MLGEMLHQTGSGIKVLHGLLLDDLRETLCYESVEAEVMCLTRSCATVLLGSVLEELFEDAILLKGVRVLGGRLAYRFVGYQEVSVRLGTGESWSVRSPYFVKSAPKRGRKKRGPNGRGCHLLLELLGFVGRCSSGFVSEVVQMGLLCPSLEVAHEVLASRGLAVDVKTIRRLCGALGQLGMQARGVSALEAGESLAGKTVVIGIDGGRLRLRQKKRGRKRHGQKRQGYHTPWREPKLFTLYVLDEQGKVDKCFCPVHDATMGVADDVFELLANYLRPLDIDQAQRVIFTADGARWIWNRIPTLSHALGLGQSQVVEVVDHFHATEHLWELVEMCQHMTAEGRKRLYDAWKSLLWQGDIPALKQAVKAAAKGKLGSKMLKAFSYFEEHAARMQYQRFKQEGIPQGSGAVESAIRRIINLRLKAPGTFWTPEMAECFLFLRSQLLSGRWQMLMAHVCQRRRSLWPEPINEPQPINQSDNITPIARHKTSHGLPSRAA
jgi:hypothetical protein